MWPLENLGAVASTQQCVRDRLQGQATGASPDAFGVYSLEQRAGIGQHGRHWQHCGEALACSLAWALPARSAGLAHDTPPWPLWVSAVVSEGLEQALELAPGSIQIKWPNDLYFQDRKCGGVLVSQLVSHQRPWLIAGIGLNLRWHEPPKGFEASGLLQDSQLRLDEALARRLVVSMVMALDPLRHDQPSALQWHRAFAVRDWLRGRSVRLVHPVTGEQMAQGLALGVDDHGRLELQNAQGDRSVHAMGEASLRISEEDA